ncbi:hypothetical protein ACLMJK_005562 [Lecanora helva]
MTIMDYEGKQQLRGIQEIHCPGNADIDIVAVHGLNGDAYSTWTSDKGNVCWLSHQDLLPKYVPNARVLTYGYNANVIPMRGRTTSADRILQHAQTLVQELVGERALEGRSEIPIIFLCHSLGGIIVKRALAYSISRTASKISHLHSMYTCTYGILFFGTPHLGSNKAHLLSNLQKMTSMTIPKKLLECDSDLVRALEEDSEVLQNITDQFAPLMSRFHIYFFWEQERTDLKYTKDYIVNEPSAAPILDDTERSGIAADHRNMVKFEGKDSPGFRTVVAAIRRYAQEAPKVITIRIADSNAILKSLEWQKASELVGNIQRQNQSQAIEASESTNFSQNSWQHTLLQ